MLNSIGLANPGRERFLAETLPALRELGRAALGLGRRLRGATTTPRRAPGSTDVTIELNLSCPNVDEAPESAAEIVAACRAATELPLYAKLSPAAWDIAEIARAVEAAGADGLSLVNTIRGLALDDGSGRRLARATGGYSGPALKPIALAAVYACRRATQLPIVGMGGVQTGRDVLELARLRSDPRRARNGALRRPATRPRESARSSPTSVATAGFDRLRGRVSASLTKPLSTSAELA